MTNKIIFMGTPMFSVPILKSLYQNGYPIECVYTQPPQKSQRGQKINKSPIQKISETLNLGFRSPNSLKENENKSYTDLEKIKKEVNHAKNTFKKYKWPTIDVTRKSVEETAASIIKIYEIYKQNG